jgi:hypothetical protein
MMIKKHKMDSPYAVMPFKYHLEVKEALLSMIERANYNSPQDAATEVNITKADWFDANNMKREWVQYVAKPLLEQLAVLYKEIGFDSLEVKEIWFQQYLQGSEHGWHTHSSNFTNVYYLEFPEGSPKTMLINPYDRKTTFEMDAKEGDLVLFPSYVAHKAPINNSLNRKTIISYNIDAMASDSMYSNILES